MREVDRKKGRRDRKRERQRGISRHTRQMVTDKTDSHTQRERRRQMVTDRENILAGIGNSGLSKELPTSTMFRPDKLRCHSRKMYSYVLHWFPILPLANKMILSFSSSSPRHLTSLLSFPKRLLFSLFPLFSFSPSISLYQWLLIPVFRLFSSPSLPSPRPCLLFSAFLHISFPFHLLSKFPPFITFHIFLLSLNLSFMYLPMYLLIYLSIYSSLNLFAKFTYSHIYLPI